MSEDKLSTNQKEILQQFRSNLSDLLAPHHTDDELLKWLRVRNFDLKKAERNFRQVDLHRRMFSVDKLNDTYVKPKVQQEYERTTFLGFSKNGSPIRYTYLNVDTYGFIQSLSQFDISSFLLDIVENDIKCMREESKRIGQNPNGVICVFNMDGYAFQELSNRCVYEVCLDYIRVVQDYHPEFWQYMIFINVPYIFYKFFLLFKPVMKKTFIEKVKIASKGTTLELLREFMDDDLIPAHLGGKRVDSNGDPYCRELINPYRKIPEEYYLRNSMHFIDEADPDVKVTTIRARGCYNVSLIVREAGSKIRLEMRTENGSINFMILYREFDPDQQNQDLPQKDEYIDPDEENSKVLLAGLSMRIQMHISPCDVTCIAVWPGIYILQFDNTSSWFGPRKLYYRFTVTPPDS